MEHFIQCIPVLLITFSLVSGYKESPDVRFLKEIGQELWENLDELLQDALNIFDIDDDFFEFLPDFDDLNGKDDPDTYGCTQCRTFVGTIQGFIERGFTFEEIRDEAVVICYGIVEGMGYNGTVMCDGIIDNYGPHVYYVLNVTDLDARGVCEFHGKCSSTQGYYESYVPPQAKAEKRLPEAPKVSNPRPAKKDMIRIAQVTDVHFDEKYAPGSPTDCNLPLCCRDYWEGTGVANEWGDYKCAIPIPTLELLFQSLADMRPHIVINTGDTPPHALWEETQTGQIEYSRWLAETIERFFPDSSAYMCVGNHDSYPTNLYYAERPQIQALNRNLTEMYARLSNWTDEAIETMEIGGYYVMEIMPGLKVMAINSNYGYTDNFYGVFLPDSYEWQQHTEYIENAFIEARANGEKILLLGHHTIGGFEFYVDWINLMMETYGDVILMQLQGHSHSDTFQLSSDETLTPTSVMITCSTMGTNLDKNPTMRMYYLDPVTYTPLEWEHYFINLTKTQNGVTPEIELMYSTFDDYGMPDLSLQSFVDVIDRMETDDDLYYLYNWNRATRTPGSEPGECEGECRFRFSCDMRTSSGERYEQCIQQNGTRTGVL